MSLILHVIGVADVVLGSGAANVSVLNDDIPDMPLPEAAWAPSSAPDGRAFFVTADLDNTETLQSVDCGQYCNFG